MQAVCSTSVTGIKGLSVARSSGQLHDLKLLDLPPGASETSCLLSPRLLLSC